MKNFIMLNFGSKEHQTIMSNYPFDLSSDFIFPSLLNDFTNSSFKYSYITINYDVTNFVVHIYLATTCNLDKIRAFIKIDSKFYLSGEFISELLREINMYTFSPNFIKLKQENMLYVSNETIELEGTSSFSDKTSITSHERKNISQKNSQYDLFKDILAPYFEYYVNEIKEQNAFYICDLSVLKKQHSKWKTLLPRVLPFYAVKCNNDKEVLKTLIELGLSFDCASQCEIQTMLELGVPPANIIFANPCKQSSYIKYAYENGVDYMTFDSEEELYKTKKLHPKANLVMRIHVDDSKSICQLGLKFGVRRNTSELFKTAKNLNLEIVGISFHVGSGCCDANAYYDAIKRSREVFDEALSYGFKMTLLDIGGGFPGYSGNFIEFEDFAKVINDGLSDYFSEDITIIAEPGRYYAASVFTLATNITSRRTVIEDNKKKFMYFVNDGVYGSFNCLIYDHAVLPKLRYLIKDPTTGVFCYRYQEDMYFGDSYSCSVWGPTCDSMDCLVKKIEMPELDIGDWIIYENMGAYTLCASSRFNGIEKAKVYYIDSEKTECTKSNYFMDNMINDKRTFLIDEDFDS